MPRLALVIICAARFLALFDAHSLAQPTTSSPRGQSRAEAIVQQLRELPAALPGTARSDGTIDPIEKRRRELYESLRTLGPDALPALAQGLQDQDVRLRKNVALALNALAGNWFDRLKPQMDIRGLLSALIGALDDNDASVRAWSAHAIGEIGPDAARAVPSLVTMLASSDEGSRIGACIGLHGIGPAAQDALPALQIALTDQNDDVRRFAQRAIDRIRKQ